MTSSISSQPPPSYYPPQTAPPQPHIPVDVSDLQQQQHFLHSPHEQPKPNDFLILSVINILCLSPLFGLIALVYSIKSRDSYHLRRYDAAKRYSKRALIFNFVGIVFIFVNLILLFIYSSKIFNQVVKNQTSYSLFGFDD
jgi:hypothetical protein